MSVDKIIDEAYKLYMPQDRFEITTLASLLEGHYLYKLKNCDYGMKTLEIGTKFGGTFHIWCSLFSSENDINISIDMSDGGIHGGISEEEMNKRDLSFKEKFNNCHFIRGDSHDWNTHYKVRDIIHPREIKPWGETIDFLFIDGDHTYEGVKTDFEMYSPFVKQGGYIAFHDINDSQKHRDRNVYVGKFWNEIKTDSRFTPIVINSNLDWAGIGVLAVR